MPVFEHIIRLIAPHHCVGCGAEGPLLCDLCEKKLGANNERCRKCEGSIKCTCFAPVRHTYSATTYTSLSQTLVWKLKFERTSQAASVIAKLCAPLVPLDADIICHVPTANRRVRMRGYDHAKLIARNVAQYSALPYGTLLVRMNATRQVGASAEVRRSQLAGAFRTSSPYLVKGAHVVLIDDVLTTGATAKEAAATLLQAGAKTVDVIVFAHVQTLQGQP